MNKKQTVFVGLSGGIDSSVTALLLQQQGYNVVGVHLELWTDPLVKKEYGDSKCCSIETKLRVRMVADKLNIPFYIIDLREEFKALVVDYFLNMYRQGWTPNPCIVCNREIKFGLVFDRLKKLGGDLWATGHYAKIKQDKKGYHLLQAKDKLKDQSYFIYTLGQEQLSKILFPLGDLTKSEVKKIATKFKIESFGADYQESQNLCFYPEMQPAEFLERYLPKEFLEPGAIVDTTGKAVGKHHGLAHYTIGQRKGLEVGGLKDPSYVIEIRRNDNTIVVGKNEDLYSKTCLIESPSFVSGELPESLKNLEIFVRYTKFPSKGDIEKQDDNYRITFQEPVRAITPGQSAVFMKKGEILGGGVITGK